MSLRRRAWAVVAILWVAATLNYVDRQAIFALFEPVRRELVLSDWQLGLLSTAFLWVYGIFSPLGGFLADRFSRRTVILVSVGIWSVITAATGAASTFGELLAARALMGISEAFYLPAALALIADYHRSETRSLATGVHQSGLYAGIILGGAGAGLLGEHYGWRAAFYVLGVAGLVYAAVAVFVLRDVPRTAAETSSQSKIRMREAVPALLRSPEFVRVATVFALASMAYWMVYTWLPLYLLERFSMGLAAAGFSATVYVQVASFAAILAGGWWSDRWSRKKPGARAIVQALGFAAAGPFLFLTGTTSSVPVLIVALIAFGLGRGLYDCNVMPVLCEFVDPRLRATAYGVLNLLGCVAGGVMAAAAGALKATLGLGTALQISGVLLLLCAWILARLAGKTH